MAKDPAINWYFDNWVGGTKGLNRFQKGCYFDLLTAQFYIGPLSLEQIKNELGPDFHVWESIKKKFIQTESGDYYNERLAAEIRKRQKYSESRSKNRKNKDMNNISNTHVEHIKNTPEIGIGTDIEIKERGAGENHH